jgi:hypothetical protein
LGYAHERIARSAPDATDAIPAAARYRSSDDGAPRAQAELNGPMMRTNADAPVVMGWQHPGHPDRADGAKYTHAAAVSSIVALCGYQINLTGEPWPVTAAKWDHAMPRCQACAAATMDKPSDGRAAPQQRPPRNMRRRVRIIDRPLGGHDRAPGFQMAVPDTPAAIHHPNPQT